MKPNTRNAVQCFVKVGTWSLERVWIRGTLLVGQHVRFNRGNSGDKWQDARIWQINEDGLIFLEL